MSKLYACIISRDARKDEEVLMSIACGFAYRVEVLEDGILFDISGLEKLVGNAKAVAQSILKKLKEQDVSGSVSVAGTIDAALLLARQNSGLDHAAATGEKFRQLPLRNLDIDRDTAGIFEALGMDRVEDLRRVPPDELIARYGRDFRDVLDVISQTEKRCLTPNIKEKNVSWAYELDSPVDDFTQLIFIINRALDELLAQTAHHGHSTERIDIFFKLDGQTEKSYEIRTSFPTLDKNFWLKIMNLRISVDPPASGIVSIRVTANFTRPRPAQAGLYAVSRPQPESLLLTAGKLKKLVGEENVGVPVILQKRLEHAFTLDAGKLPAGKEKISDEIVVPVIAFSYYDPPLPAEIFVRNRQLIYLRTQHFRGRVLAYSGVWKTSSQWWGNLWSTREWHVEIESGGIYRLIKHGPDWFVAGEFD
jgi:protein ImuB